MQNGPDYWNSLLEFDKNWSKLLLKLWIKRGIQIFSYKNKKSIKRKNKNKFEWEILIGHIIKLIERRFHIKW